MGNSKPFIGLIVGIIVAVAVILMPIEGLSPEGQLCLGLTLMTIVFWGMQIAQSGYISGLYLALLIIFNVAKPEVVLSPWTGSTMYLVIGAYLIAGAVRTSGLGERIAYKFILHFVDSYKSIIISIFALTFILSLLIPHPWPRAFLIMSVMAVVIKSANVPKEDAVKIGFTVFAASVPVSLIFLTGDSVINTLAVQASGVPLTWLGWFYHMGVPNIITSILTCILILFLLKPTKEISINKEDIHDRLVALGSMSTLEKKTVVWLVIAIILWMGDAMHGIDLGWITLLIAMLMSLPVIGGVLTPKNWSEVPIHVLLFLTAAIAIGKVGGVSGMNEWIALTILPETIPDNPYILAIFITTIAVGIHMVLGSVIAVMGIAIPALLTFTQPMGINPLIPTLLVYTAIAAHYVLPFHHLNMLVGLGEENGMYSQKETIRIGIPLTIVIYFITVCIEIPWWHFTKLFE